MVAIAFVVLGAVLFYLEGVTVDETSSVAFAGDLLTLFTKSFGEWAFPDYGGRSDRSDVLNIADPV